jgi:2-polyprenyl-3-methyl-5-hydroxy-6-metoxy-1,4-benzoquinol methylase
MPTVREIAELYHEDLPHFDPYIDQTSVHRAYFRKKITEIIEQLTTNNLQLSLLDIGCATGILLEEVQQAGFQAIGIDISKDIVTHCRKKGLKVFAGTIQSVRALRPSSFDVITAFQIIEHERNPKSMVKRIYSLLKKGGLVVLATPNYGGIWRKIMGKHWVGFSHPEHVALFTPESMTRLLKDAGFGDIHAKRDSPRPFPLSFAFTRAADYFPKLAWIFKPIGRLFEYFKFINPINPWDDMIVFAKKE